MEKGSIERYNPQNGEEERHEILGNLYLPSSIMKMKSSFPFRMDDIQSREMNVRENRIRARLTLLETVAGYPAFYYIHAAKHGAEEVKLHTRRKIRIFDNEDSEDVTIDIPEKFDIKDLRKPWESDVILMVRYDIERGVDDFKLARYLGEVLVKPKLSLANRIMNPRLPEH